MLTHRAILAVFIVMLCGAAALSQPSLSPPAGAISESGRFGLGTAVNATNTPGDADAFYKISAPGLYFLTENLIVSNVDAAIEIESQDVVLDLSGFSIRSSTDLAGNPNSEFGVSTSSTNVVIRNGTVRSFRLAGVSASNAVGIRVENVQAIRNGTFTFQINPGIGLNLGPGAAVVRCTAHDNANIGIAVAEGSSVIDSVAYGNNNNGIDADAGSAIVECVATDNGNVGIVARDSLVAHCTAFNNPTANIDIGVTGTTLVGNHAP